MTEFATVHPIITVLIAFVIEDIVANICEAYVLGKKGHK